MPNRSITSLRCFIALCLCTSLSMQPIEAGRLASMQVVQRLKELEPKHAEIKHRIVHFVYAAKSNLIQQQHEFYQQLFATKEHSLIDSIGLEDNMLFQLDHQRATADRSCLGMLRTIVDSNMNVAGVGYTNCINGVEEGLARELKRAQMLLEQDESDIFYQSLLDVFEGENVIADPDRILAKLKSKADYIDAFASDYLLEVFGVVQKFSSALCDLRNTYQRCLKLNESILLMTFEATKSQLTNICLGVIVTPASVA